MKPSNVPTRISTTPIAQFASRGLRNAPVKNVRNMWANMPARKSSADQWCTCRTNRPPRNSKLMFSALA